MKIKRAVYKLAKFFAVDADIFRPLPNKTIIAWAARIGTGYQLSRIEHAFLIGEVTSF